MSDDRVTLDEQLRVSKLGDAVDEHWVMTGGFWLPLGARVMATGLCGLHKVVGWFRTDHLADERLRRRLECDFELPPADVTAEALEHAPTGWLFLLRRVGQGW